MLRTAKGRVLEILNRKPTSLEQFKLLLRNANNPRRYNQASNQVEVHPELRSLTLTPIEKSKLSKQRKKVRSHDNLLSYALKKKSYMIG